MSVKTEREISPTSTDEAMTRIKYLELRDEAERVYDVGMEALQRHIDKEALYLPNILRGLRRLFN